MKYALVILVCALLAGCFPNYSNGSRVGVVTKMSHKGILWKSYEGTLLQGGTRPQSNADGGTNIVVNTLNFNVPDPVIAEQLFKYARTGERVEIVYRQWLFAPPWIDNDHVVLSVSPAF